MTMPAFVRLCGLTSSLVVAGACARDSRPPSSPAGAAPPAQAATGDVGTPLSDQGVAGAPQPDQGIDDTITAHSAPQAPAPAGASLFVDPGAQNPQPVRSAVAVLQPTKESHVTGTVMFRETGTGQLEVIATVDALPNGTHAYHVHVYGDCSSRDAESAGPHFHFTGSSLDKSVDIITGNLGELKDDGRLTTTHRATIPEASLHGKFSIIGRSVVVHAQGNDPTKPPDGGAGRRLACGVIGVANPQPPAPQTAANPGHH